MEAERRIDAGDRVNGPLAALMRRRNVSTTAHLVCAIQNAVFVPTLQYGGETLQKNNERKMNAVEM